MADYFSNDNSLLKNKLGISDPAKLHIVEQDIVAKNTARLLEELIPNVFDFEYLKYIHKVLFEDIYDFAGQVRNVDIVKPDSNALFAHVPYIIKESDRVFDDLKDKSYLAGLNKPAFIKEIAELSAELNALHPFRGGNGRAIRLFFILLADPAGYLLDYSQVSSKELISADKSAFEGSMQPLLNLYEKVVISYL